MSSPVAIFHLVLMLVATAFSPAFGRQINDVKATIAGLKAADQSSPLAVPLNMLPALASDDVPSSNAERAAVLLQVAAPPSASAVVPAAAPAKVSPLTNNTHAVGMYPMLLQSIVDIQLFLTTPTYRNAGRAFHASRFGLLFLVVGVFYLFGLRWDINMSSEISEKIPVRAAFKEASALRHNTVSYEPAPKDVLASEKLPTIWPKFTKLHATSQLLMPLVASDTDAWSHNVISPSGTSLLAVSLASRTGASRSLELSTVGLGRLVLASVSVTEDCFECCGLGGVKLGKFVFHEGALMLIAIDGQRLVSTTKDSDGKNVKVMAAGNNRLLGTQVERPATETLSHAYLELTIEAGVDVVLVLACVMAIRTFSSDMLADKVKSLEVDAS